MYCAGAPFCGIIEEMVEKEAGRNAGILGELSQL